VLAEFARTHSDIKVEIRRVLVEGNCAVVEWYWEDVETKTGHQTQAEDAIAIDFEQGLIRRWREYIDAKTPKARNGSA
jgi:ketosteroid isomerase-like protein